MIQKKVLLLVALCSGLSMSSSVKADEVRAIGTLINGLLDAATLRTTNPHLMRLGALQSLAGNAHALYEGNDLGRQALEHLPRNGINPQFAAASGFSLGLAGSSGANLWGEKSRLFSAGKITKYLKWLKKHPRNSQVAENKKMFYIQLLLTLLQAVTAVKSSVRSSTNTSPLFIISNWLISILRRSLLAKAQLSIAKKAFAKKRKKGRRTA